jgi:DNA-binding response OmpR family regulator
MTNDVLLIEDNHELAGLLAAFLERDGLHCRIAASGEDGLAILKKENARLVVLDVMLPGMDGFEVCRRLRETADTPLIVLSAKHSREDKLLGLQLGADDYLGKPYDVDVLIAKIKALLRRSEMLASANGTSRQKIEDGCLSIDVAARTVLLKRTGEQLDLTTMEFELLYYLACNSDKVLRKQSILDAVWGVDRRCEEATLTVHIRRLREKIERQPQNPQHIVTIWGIGYRYAVATQ